MVLVIFSHLPPPVLVDDLDADICILGTPEVYQIHVASSQVLFFKSAFRFGAFTGRTSKNSCFGDRFLLSSSSSPRSSMSPSHIVQRAATSVKTTLDMYSYCYRRIALASATFAFARYANALCDFTYSSPPRSFSLLVCSRVHAAGLKYTHDLWASVLMDCNEVVVGAERQVASLVDECTSCRGILFFAYSILFFTVHSPSVSAAPGKACSSISTYH